MHHVIAFSSDVELVEMFQKPLLSISIKENVHGYCESVTLWHEANNGVRISSEMHDAAPKLEVGVLNFSGCSSVDEAGRSFDLGGAIPILHVHKLVVNEADIIFESGIEIQLGQLASFRIVPADFPCFLAVSGAFSSRLCVPEYPESSYRSVELTAMAN